MKHVYYVLWSAGLDSTYLIYKLLEEGHTVIAGYCDIKNNRTKTIMEQKQRQIIGNKFKIVYGSRFQYHEVSLSLDIIYQNRNMYLYQIIPFICALVQTMPSNCTKVALGYVMNDDALSFIDDIRNAYYSLMKFNHIKAKLEFPLLKINKDIIVKNLPKEYFNEVVWCEYGNLDSDGCTCPSCRRAIYEGIVNIKQYSERL